MCCHSCLARSFLPRTSVMLIERRRHGGTQHNIDQPSFRPSPGPRLLATPGECAFFDRRRAQAAPCYDRPQRDPGTGTLPEDRQGRPGSEGFPSSPRLIPEPGPYLAEGHSFTLGSVTEGANALSVNGRRLGRPTRLSPSSLLCPIACGRRRWIPPFSPHGVKERPEIRVPAQVLERPGGLAHGQ